MKLTSGFGGELAAGFLPVGFLRFVREGGAGLTAQVRQLLDVAGGERSGGFGGCVLLHLGLCFSCGGQRGVGGVVVKVVRIGVCQRRVICVRSGRFV